MLPIQTTKTYMQSKFFNKSNQSIIDYAVIIYLLIVKTTLCKDATYHLLASQQQKRYFFMFDYVIIRLHVITCYHLSS